MDSEQIYEGLRIVTMQNRKHMGLCEHCWADMRTRGGAGNPAFVILHGERLCKTHAILVIEDVEKTSALHGKEPR